MTQEVKNPPVRIELNTHDFLHALKEKFGIRLIYYPGAFKDTILESAFDKSEIVYLDEDIDGDYDDEYPQFAGLQLRAYIEANYSASPFKNQVFDAIFYQDNHAGPEDFQEMLRTLKVGGIVIIGNTCMGDLSKKGAVYHPELKRLRLPFIHRESDVETLEVFQKLKIPKSDSWRRRSAWLETFD